MAKGETVKDQSAISNVSQPPKAQPQFSIFKYLAFGILGVCYMTPWNVFISATEFMRGRLAVYMASELLVITYLTYVAAGRKIHVAFWIQFSVFIPTFILSFVRLPDPSMFFAVLMLLIFLAAVATSLLASCYSLLAQRHPLYTQAFQSGQGLAGLVPSAISIISTVSSGEVSEQGPGYFSVPLVLAGVGYASFIWIARSGPQPQQKGQSSNGDIEEKSEESNSIRKAYPLVFGCGFIFLITLAIFPSITTSIYPVGDDPFLSKNLIAFHFFIFNLSDFVGKFLPGIRFFYIKSPKVLLGVTYSRIVYVILFLLCNFKIMDGSITLPRSLPVVFNDVAYLILLFSFGLTCGWFSTNLLMMAPSMVSKEASSRVGTIMVYGLIVGLFSGGMLSFVVRSIFCNCNPFTS